MSAVEVRQSVYDDVSMEADAAFMSRVGTAVTTDEDMSVGSESEAEEEEEEDEPEARKGGGRRGVTPTGLPVSELGGIVKESRIEITDAPRGEGEGEDDLESLWRGGEI